MKYKFKDIGKFNRAIDFLEVNNVEYGTFDLKNFKLINVYQDNESLDEDIFDELLASNEAAYLTGKSYKEKTIINVNGIEIGGKGLVFIAGPCSIDGEDSLLETAKALKEVGVNILRGGAFKPRTSPYDFQGLGREGVDILKRVSKAMDMPVVTELVDIRDLDYLVENSDIIQVGARNMQNFPLLKELGKIRRPVMLKRGFSSTIEEFLLSAEYILYGGNEDLILCERGIRTFETATRNTMDISSISLIKELSHLPVIADPSHGTGLRSLIESMSLAAIAAGSDGLMVESHINPTCAVTDAFQAVEPKEMLSIIKKSNQIRDIIK